MKQTVIDYYSQTELVPYLLKQKMDKLERNEDICNEFEYWILNKEYKPNGLVVNGYSAQKLAGLSRFLDGEGAFMLLIELRENPDKALKQIQQGFKLK